MSGSGLPPEGFRWIEPEAEEPRRRSRWWWLAGALVVVLVAAGAGVLMWKHSGAKGHTDGQAGPAAEPPIGSPKDLLVSFPLDRAPVPAWQLTTADLGVPAKTNIGELFASTADKAFFLAAFVDTDCADHCAPDQGRVYGVDTHSGKLLFTPIMLPDFRIGARCYSNGPAVAVCLGYKPKAVWVLDLDRGAVSFTGPSDLNIGDVPGDLPVQPVGTDRGQAHLVVALRGKGLYGIGSRGERTWFAPGDGVIYPSDNADLPPATLVAQSARVFSVIDGHDLTPTAPAGLTLGAVAVYNGGFAYTYTDDKRAHGVLFYDTTGKLITQQPLTDQFEPMMELEPAMPTVSDGGSQWRLYTAAGKPVITVPAGIGMGAGDSRAVGTKFYIHPADSGWQQWDLLTGQAGPTCTFNIDAVEYVGSDGNTIISKATEAYVLQERATDMATCQTRWETRPDHNIDMWKAGTGLIQYDRTDNTVTGLRAPD